MAGKTCKELLAIVSDPNHPSQEYFAPLKDGRMLSSCSMNGYSFAGYGQGFVRPPNFRELRKETQLHELTQSSEPKDT